MIYNKANKINDTKASIQKVDNKTSQDESPN